MADKSFRAGQLPHDRREDAASDNQHFISTSIAVTVVERLEIIDVEIGKGKGLLALYVSRGLTEAVGSDTFIAAS